MRARLKILIGSLGLICGLTYALGQPFSYPDLTQSAPFQKGHPPLPAGFTLLESVEGDLDRDGLRDWVMVWQYDHAVKERLSFVPGTQQATSTPRILLVAYNEGDGFYAVRSQSNAFILRRGEGELEADPFKGIAIDSRGILQLKFARTMHEEVWTGTYFWQYQPDTQTLGLIKAEITDHHRMKGNRFITEYNFVSNRCKHTYDNAFNGRIRPQIQEYKLHEKQLKTLKDFKRPLTWKIMEGFTI